MRVAAAETSAVAGDAFVAFAENTLVVAASLST